MGKPHASYGRQCTARTETRAETGSWNRSRISTAAPSTKAGEAATAAAY